MSLSKESIKRLRAVKRAILAEPKFYDQRHYPHTGDTCETPCCIAGWAVWLRDPERYERLLRSHVAVPWIDELAVAVGIQRGEALSLFANFQYPPQPCPGTKAHALLGAEKIDHFIKTRGAE